MRRHYHFLQVHRLHQHLAERSRCGNALHLQLQQLPTFSPQDRLRGLDQLRARADAAEQARLAAEQAADATELSAQYEKLQAELASNEQSPSLRPAAPFPLPPHAPSP